MLLRSLLALALVSTLAGSSADGAQMTLEPDDGPIYLVGDIAVTSLD